ncbi:hypothetical protein COF41_25710 [Bacillus toyonensis]|uniref:hypothetical protein n=1 Tax=Bacillus toyonensis TaxID=155322 RepID=UPI000BFBDDF1|nr:hypothetical protein [Bacillus toyonensis]MED2615446.1 hypothetical protein [Bacillus toyonensis]PHE12658.1 hypothetical protein COF41_25710 [Bacillus toyonensis]
MLKKIVVGTLALGLVTGIGGEYASAATINLPTQPINNALHNLKADPGTLIDDRYSFKRSGKVYFDYLGSEEGMIRIYIKNYGVSPVTFKLVNPKGSNLMSGYELDPGESIIQEMYLPDPTSKKDRTYYFYFKNEDGTKIDVHAKVGAI